jgi:hypothetical protein
MLGLLKEILIINKSCIASFKQDKETTLVVEEWQLLLALSFCVILYCSFL